MSTSRNLPTSNVGRQKATNAMVAKNDSIVPPATSALTAATIVRLNIDNTDFDNALAAVVVAESAQRRTMTTANTHRALLHDNISGVFRSVNTCIDLGTMPNDARADYGLPISNRKSPMVDTDDKLILWGQKIIDGDAIRVAAGGIAMGSPTIAQFTIVYDDAIIAITALNTAKDLVGTKQTAVNVLKPEMDKIIKRGWNEIEATYSELDDSAKRAACRLWGIKYISVGLPAVVSGIITHSITGLPMANVKVRISGSNNKTLTDAFGRYSLNTNLYGDLELLTSYVGYTDGITDFLKANGVDATIDVVMMPV